MLKTSVFLVTIGSDSILFTNHKNLPLAIQPGIYGKGKNKVTFRPVGYSSEDDEVGRLIDWPMMPEGTWILLGNDKKMWTVQISGSYVPDADFIATLDEIFVGDHFTRAATFKLMEPELQARFRNIDIETQIWYLKVPESKKRSVFDGKFEEYIAWYSLPQNERRAINQESENRREKECKKIEVARRRAQDKYRYRGGPNAVAYDEYRSANLKMASLSSLASPRRGLTIAVRVSKKDLANMESVFDEMWNNPLIFPTDILRIVSNLYLVRCVRDWLYHGISYSHDTNTTSKPTIGDLKLLRRIDIGLYIDYHHFDRSAKMNWNWIQNDDLMQVLMQTRPEIFKWYCIAHEIVCSNIGTSCKCARILKSEI